MKPPSRPKNFNNGKHPYILKEKKTPQNISTCHVLSKRKKYFGVQLVLFLERKVYLGVRTLFFLKYSKFREGNPKDENKKLGFKSS